MVTNKELMDAAFDVLGDEVGAGNEAAFKAVNLAMKTPSLNSFAPDALGIAAAQGHAESLRMLVHPDGFGLADSQVVWALQKAAAANKPEAIDYLVTILDNPKVAVLWEGAKQGLTLAARQGNEKAKAALARNEAAEKSATKP
jgi:hypothetical protein